MKIKENAQLTADSGEPHHVASFSFQGPKGWKFGEEFKIKFKVEKALDEVEFYNLAMEIFEEMKQSNSSKQEISFETVVEVLKKAGSNGRVAKEILSQMANNNSDVAMK